ncbi:MAG TPA: glycosyltransferase family A protein, partial [Acidimicrobiales bacterium]|nr:glycosyltransferase family A protein [Acidimicrobiales bacterium]
MTAPSDEPAVGIVVPARDVSATIGLLLDDLAAQSPEGVRVVVVDDASTDGTGDLVEARAAELPWLSLVRGTGAGPATARNLGAGAVNGGWLAFVDADVRLDPDWLRAGMAATGREDADVLEGVVVPRGGDDRGLVLHTASSSGGEVFVTANLWVRREAFERVGGFDASYQVPWREDTDLGWRLLAAGARARAAADVVVFHPHARR